MNKRNLHNEKHIVLIMAFFLLLIINQAWAEGSQERSSDGIHPGARMVLEANGYTFDSSGDLSGYRNFSIMRFPNENSTNTNPYAYEANVIYLTNFDVNQWIEKSVLATTGSQSLRQNIGMLSPDLNTILRVGGMGHGTRIFVRNIPDIFLSQMSGNIQNAFLVYIGAQTFQMADGSSQVFPVFELIDLFNSTVSEVIDVFNQWFDEGIIEERNGYQYSRIAGRTFGRDIATKRELHEWNGEQWIQIWGN